MVVESAISARGREQQQVAKVAGRISSRPTRARTKVRAEEEKEVRTSSESQTTSGWTWLRRSRQLKLRVGRMTPTMSGHSLKA